MDRIILKKVIEHTGISQEIISSSIGMEPSVFSLKINNRENSNGVLEDFSIKDIDKLIKVLGSYLDSSSSKNVACSLMDIIRSGNSVVNSLSGNTYNLIGSGNYKRLIEELILLEHYGHKVMNINLIKPPVRLRAGEESIISARILPDESINKNVIWTSSDQGIIGVEPITSEFNTDLSARVYAKNKGSAVIRVETEDGSHSDSCEIDVEMLVERIEIINLPERNRLKKGRNLQLLSKVTPDGALVQSVIWSSSNQDVISVDPISGLITANKNGMASIKAQTDDGKFMAITELKVTRSKLPAAALIASAIILTAAVFATLNRTPSKTVMQEVSPLPSMTDKGLTLKEPDVSRMATNTEPIVINTQKPVVMDTPTVLDTPIVIDTPESTEESYAPTQVLHTSTPSVRKNTPGIRVSSTHKPYNTPSKSIKSSTPFTGNSFNIEQLSHSSSWKIKSKSNSVVSVNSDQNGRSNRAVRIDFFIKNNEFVSIAGDTKVINSLPDGFNKLQFYYKSECQSSYSITVELKHSNAGSQMYKVNTTGLKNGMWNRCIISDQDLKNITGIEIKIENSTGQNETHDSGSLYICDFAATR